MMKKNLAVVYTILHKQSLMSLKKKHPEASPELPEVMLEVKSELPDQVIYESIDADLIQKVGKRSRWGRRSNKDKCPYF